MEYKMIKTTRQKRPDRVIDKTKYFIKYKKIVYDLDLAERIKLNSVGKLAKYLGFSSQYVSMIIHGKIIISEDIYQTIKLYFQL